MCNRSLGSFLGALARSRSARVWIHDKSILPGNLQLTAGYFHRDTHDLSNTRLSDLADVGRQNAHEKSHGVGLTTRSSEAMDITDATLRSERRSHGRAAGLVFTLQRLQTGGRQPSN